MYSRFVYCTWPIRCEQSRLSMCWMSLSWLCGGVGVGVEDGRVRGGSAALLII